MNLSGKCSLKREISQERKNECAEEMGFRVGKHLYEQFEKTGNLATARAMVSTIRLMLQAIRDNKRYMTKVSEE